MRNKFGEVLYKLGSKDKEIYLNRSTNYKEGILDKLQLIEIHKKRKPIDASFTSMESIISNEER